MDNLVKAICAKCARYGLQQRYKDDPFSKWAGGGSWGKRATMEVGHDFCEAPQFRILGPLP